MGRVYVFIRAKKGSSVMERFKKQIVGSPLFEPLKKQLGQAFNSFIENKIALIQGDILEPELGLSPQDLQTLT